MKFSILIAHYNNWDYFQECYKSIINQTFENFEIVIVDDCSTDDSYNLLLELAKTDNRIKLFQNSENKKVGFTKMRCAEEAQGDICMFVDPDDMISHTALEEIYNEFANHSNIVATYSKIKLINEESKPIGFFKFSKKIQNNKKYFFNINFEVAHLFSFKREIFLKTTGINPQLTSAVDQDLYLKLYELGNFKFINSYQYLYRLHSKGVSQDKSKKETLNSNWHTVLLDTCKRRNIDSLGNKKLDSIDNLPKLLFAKENTLIKKIVRKFL